MSQSLQDLERAALAAPDDAEAARAFEAALLEAGKRGDVRVRYRFKFACPMKWTEFTAVEDLVGHCGKCDRDVYYVDEEQVLAFHIQQGHCVAVHPQKLEGVIDDLVDHPLYHSAKEALSTCVVDTKDPSGLPKPPVPEQHCSPPGGLTPQGYYDLQGRFHPNPNFPEPVFEPNPDPDSGQDVG